MFEFFTLNYPFWNHGLDEQQVKAKMRAWSQYMLRHPDDRIREAMQKVVERVADKSGPTLAQVLECVEKPAAHQVVPKSNWLDRPRSGKLAKVEIEKMRALVGLK